MESTELLLSELAALDVKLWVEEDELCFDAPEGILEGDLRARVLAAKPNLITFLSRKEDHPLTTSQENPVLDIPREAPVTATELRLAALWRDILKTDEICRNDDFFTLGGHSLLLMRLILRINAEGLGQIDLGQAIEARTLVKMAALIDAVRGNPSGKQNPGDLAPIAEQNRAPESLPPAFVDIHFQDNRKQQALVYNRDFSLTELWQASVSQHPDLTALMQQQDRYSYRQLDDWSERLAEGLSLAGVKKGDTVAFALPRCPEAVATIIAILKCGAAYLPLDEKIPTLLVERLLETSSARWLIADEDGRERLSSISKVKLLPVERLATTSENKVLFEKAKVGGGAPAYIMFTSGSTGEPKGVLVPHRGVARLALNTEAYALKQGDGMAQTASFGFDASTLEIWSTLLAGARLVFISDQALMQPTDLGASLHKSGVSIMFLTPSLFNRAADLYPQAFKSLSVLISGGEVMSIPHLKKIRAACPTLQIINAYGPTENTTFTTCHIVSSADLVGESMPIGRPIFATRVHVLDESLKPVPFGSWGELCAAGDGLALGYAGRPDLTNQVFISLPNQPQERIYRTGDLARWRPDGVLEFGGRRDGQVKIRGHRIECSAIEAVLCEYPGVHDALVMATGEGENRELTAFVASGTKSEMVWRQYLAERLPSYMMPARFIVLAALPTNANGKKDRASMTAMLSPTGSAGKDGMALLLASENIARGIPLSYGQERLWILQRLTPESGLYNIPMACDIRGEFDTASFTRALLALEERHHALRLVIRPANDEVQETHQQLLPPGNLAPRILDFRGSVQPVAAADDRMHAESIRPFLLEKETPARAFLLQLSDDHWRFLLVIHHIACDGWSVDVLLREMEALHAQESDAKAAALPPITYQYGDYATWQRAFLGSNEGRRLLERRTQSLSSALQPLDLPADHRRPAIRTYEGNTVEIPFDPATSQCIDQLAETAKVTPFVLLLGLVEVLLYRLCGRGASGDFSIGTLSSGRDRPELAGLVGFFVNTLVMPCHIKAEQSFSEHLERVRNEWTNVLADQHCPFAHLVESLKLPRDLTRNPLFDVLVVWQDNPPDISEKSLFKADSVQPRFPYSKFDLSFHFQKRGREILLSLEYSTELFEPSTALCFGRRLQALISSVARNPSRRLTEFDLWLPEERQQVIETFNATRKELPTRRSITEPFLDCLRNDPGAPAVISAQGEIWNYSRFARRAAAVAAQLTAAGLKRGDLVVVIIHRSPEMMAAIHGILMAGAAYVPLDPEQPKARLQELLKDLGKPLALCGVALQPQLSEYCRPLALPPESAEAEPISQASPDDIAYIIFTSGSTGRPKGVLIEHHAVLNRILWMQQTFPIGAGDVILQKTPTTFDVSVWELFWWSWTGAAVAMLGPGEERDPEALALAIEKHRVTTIHFVPSMLSSFLDCLESGWFDVRRLATLKRVFVSGEALDSTLALRFNRLIFDRLGTELHNLYGPTEATVDVSWQAASPWTGGEALSIGRPIANTHFYILDAENKPLPVGIPGEIAIGGVQVARGYFNRPELSAERFVSDPLDPKKRVYLSGDLGRWKSDGSIEYLGRVDWQVKIRGQRIEPGEIEHTLELHPQIKRGIVVPVKNQGLTELHAWLFGDAPPNIAELRLFLRQHLPESMVPARFFTLDELPQTSSGKLDRQLLVRRSQEMLNQSAVIPAAKRNEANQIALNTCFRFDESKETLTLSLSFDPSLVSKDAVAALAERYSALLTEVGEQTLDGPGRQ